MFMSSLELAQDTQRVTFHRAHRAVLHQLEGFQLVRSQDGSSTFPDVLIGGCLFFEPLVQPLWMNESIHGEFTGHPRGHFRRQRPDDLRKSVALIAIEREQS